MCDLESNRMKENEEKKKKSTEADKKYKAEVLR